MTVELSQGHGMTVAVAIASAFVVTWAGECRVFEGILSGVS